MGCVASKKTMVRQYRDENMPIAQRLASEPRTLSNGNTFIPVNYLNGRYPTMFPKWLENDISPRKYSHIIEKLNNLNKSSPIFSEDRMYKYHKLSPSKAKLLQNKDRKYLNEEMDKLLLEINTNTLNPLGLNICSMLRNHTIDPSKMGVVIKKIHIHCSISSGSLCKGHLIILPCYEYENVLNEDGLSDSEYSQYE